MVHRSCHLGPKVGFTVGVQLLPMGLAEQPDGHPSPSSQVPGQRGLGPSLLPKEEQRGACTPKVGPRLTHPRGRPRAGRRLPAAELGGPGEGAAQQPEGWPV